MVQGANALLLDIDYGTYHFVASSSTGTRGRIAWLALSPVGTKEIVGGVKAYTTRVEPGPLPTEFFDVRCLGRELRAQFETNIFAGIRFSSSSGWKEFGVVSNLGSDCNVF